MQPLVTVVIPTYNSAKYIQDALQSVLAQTYSNIEIIVMDGASKDGTADIARSIAPNATVISEPDRGQTHAINKGWEMAKGDIVTWLCADDGYYPDTVANAVNYLEANPDAMWVYGLADHLDENGIPSPMRYLVTAWNYEKLLSWANYIVQPSTFLKREILLAKGLPSEKLYYSMDYEYWIRIGKDFPGHFVPSIRVWVKVYQNTKSRSGGLNRMIEIRDLIQSYGGSHIPSLWRWEWTQSHILELSLHLRRREFSKLWHDLREIFRYPASLPKGILKAIAQYFISPSWDTRLRRLLIRRQDQIVSFS